MYLIVWITLKDTAQGSPRTAQVSPSREAMYLILWFALSRSDFEEVLGSDLYTQISSPSFVRPRRASRRALMAGYVRCPCRLTYWGQNDGNRQRSLRRCAGRHILPEDADSLVLREGNATDRNTLFVIMFCDGNRCSGGQVGGDRWAKRQLIDQLQIRGVPDDMILTVKGFSWGTELATQCGNYIAPFGICHFSFLHRWFPLVKNALEARPHIRCVVYLEANALMEVQCSEVLAEVNNMPRKKDICWLGWYRERGPHGWAGRSARNYRLLQGSKAIAFKGGGLRAAWKTVFEKKGYYHLDAMLSRKLRWRVATPKPSMFGYRGHHSVPHMGQAHTNPRYGYPVWKPAARFRQEGQ